MIYFLVLRMIPLFAGIVMRFKVKLLYHLATCWEYSTKNHQRLHTN